MFLRGCVTKYVTAQPRFAKRKAALSCAASGLRVFRSGVDHATAGSCDGRFTLTGRRRAPNRLSANAAAERQER
jgi:hypothetical protein